MSDPAPEGARHAAADARAGPLDRGFVLTLAGATAVVLFLYMVRQVLLPFVIAGLIAFICEPAVRYLSRRFHAPRAAAAVVVFLALVGLAAAFAFFAAAPLARWFAGTIARFPDIIQTLVGRLMAGRTLQVMGQSLDAKAVSAELFAALRQVMQPNRLLPIVALGFGGVFAAILGWILLFYFLLSGPQLGAGVLGLIPPPHRPLTQRIWARLAPVLRRYFIGVGIIVLYASCAAYLGLGVALGLHDAIPLAITTGVLEMVPVAGPLASAVIAGLAAVEQATGVGAILGYAAYAVALRISIDEVFGPLVLGRAARLHPTVVIFCFLTGALLFGVVGVILAAPAALTVKIVLSTIYAEQQAAGPVVETA